MIVSEEMVISTRMATHGFVLASLCQYYVSFVARKSQKKQKILQHFSRKQCYKKIIEERLSKALLCMAPSFRC